MKVVLFYCVNNDAEEKRTKNFAIVIQIFMTPLLKSIAMKISTLRHSKASLFNTTLNLCPMPNIITTISAH